MKDEANKLTHFRLDRSDVNVAHDVSIGLMADFLRQSRCSQ